MSEEFPELEEFERLQKSRHRLLVAGLMGVGATLVALAIGILIFAAPTPGMRVLGATFLIMGLICAGRGALSQFTDHDTKDRGAFDEQ